VRALVAALVLGLGLAVTIGYGLADERVDITATDGVQLIGQLAGTSGPGVVLVPGPEPDTRAWEAAASAIAAAGFRVLLHDRRNTGASGIVIDGDEGEEAIWADDLHALLGQLRALPAFIGGASSGSRTSLLFYLRHPEAVRALLLMQLTGGAFAAGRLPEHYYGQYIRAARAGGLAAVCATEMYRERIAANPSNRARLMNMDPAHFIAVMERWLAIFMDGPKDPLIGISEAQLRAVAVPTLVIPGNDKTHSAVNGRAAQKLIPGSELFELPIESQDVTLIAFSQWKEHEPAIAGAFTDFMYRVTAKS
jgi:pimeloyl-ACP methyl ester carboxylesterase